MSRHKPPPVKEDISPNVVPMIDIMFLLLLFFMLGADMSQRESVEVKLPRADQIKEDLDTDKDPVATINVHPASTTSDAVLASLAESRDPKLWVISMRGIEYSIDPAAPPDTSLRTQLKIESDEYPEDAPDKEAGKVLSRKKVLIRAEGKAPFGLVQKVIETCGSVGLYKVEVAGAKPAGK